MAASSVEEAEVKSLPSSAYYIADFITEEEEQMLLNKVSVCYILAKLSANFERSQQPQNLAGNNSPIDECKYGHQT
jgi:hypothetical protein